MNRALNYLSLSLYAALVLANAAAGLGGMAFIWLCVFCFALYRFKTGRA